MLAQPGLYERDRCTRIAEFLTDGVVDLEGFPDRVEADGMPVMAPLSSDRDFVLRRE